MPSEKAKRILRLPLKGTYFDEIKARIKPWEYRRVTSYWRKRLEGREYDLIELTRGYPKRGDSERRLILPWQGYQQITLIHPFFGDLPVEVFAINVAH